MGYAVRWLTRGPGFTTAPIVTIALGVGLNAGIFTALNGVLSRDMPAPERTIGIRYCVSNNWSE